MKHSSSVGNLNIIDLTEPVKTVTGTNTAKGTVVDAVIKLYTLLAYSGGRTIMRSSLGPICMYVYTYVSHSLIWWDNVYKA